MADHNEMVAEFINITGCDGDRAQFYLESSGWQLQVAIASFYDTGDMEDTPDTLPAQPHREYSEPDPPQPAAESESKSKPKSSRTSGSRFTTLSDMQPGEESDSSEDEGQTFYAGGSERGGSGQQIVGPGKKKSDKIVDEIFKSAKDHGAQEVEAGTPAPSTSRTPDSAFRGAGYRLGDTEGGDTVPVAGTAGAFKSKPKDVDVVLRLWKNGFTVNDEEMRSYKDPKNAAFLNSVTNGEIPRELVRLAKGGQVNLDMEDHRDEEYRPPPPTLKPFGGAGHKLGSPTPNVISSPAPASSQAAASAPSTAVQLDESQPMTTLQIRLADSSKLVQKFNHTHTVGDVRRFLLDSRPQYGSQPFALMTTFPNKELTDENQSLAQANLMNAVIVQRLK